ncbi:Glutamine transport ATP-binding protein glnQ [Staphylococcus aureus]|nr:Glutamine transport ATP-binding protein glnQ [Staphylococcus aureus]SUK45354.1 Glutamine transport ATP-binding protein glnQ [Staphylococcus aureus]
MPVIKINNLNKVFGDNEVLKDINLEINQGEVVAIIGPSGSGKSTLLRCMNLLEVPTKGQVIFEGNDLTEKGTQVDKLRQKWVWYFKTSTYFHIKKLSIILF